MPCASSQDGGTHRASSDADFRCCSLACLATVRRKALLQNALAPLSTAQRTTIQMGGDSKKPLALKLGIARGQALAILNPPDGYDAIPRGFAARHGGHT